MGLEFEPCSFWKNPEGIELACYEWVPSNEPKFVLYLVHGYADRLNGYPKLIEMVNAIGGIVYAHDHFAHGKSGPYPQDHPKRCQIENLYHTARDVNFRVKEAKKKHHNLPLIMLGHSLGGLIAALTVQQNPENIDALILEAPAFKIHEASAKWYLVLGAKILSRIAPEFKLGEGDVDFISRNKDVNAECKRLEPEYGDNGGMMARTAMHMLNVQTKLMTEINQIKVKTLICQGTDDRLCSFEGSKQAHNQMPNSQMKIYEGAYHCLHDELPETTEAFLNDVKEFIAAFL